MVDLLSEERLGGLPHLLDNGSSDLRGRVLLALSLNPGVAVLGRRNELVGDVLDVVLDLLVGELSSNESARQEQDGQKSCQLLWSA